MSWFCKKVPRTFFVSAILLGSVPIAVAQKSPPKAGSQPAAPAKSQPQAQMQPQPAAPTQQQGHRTVIVEPIRVFDPSFDYPYPYAYEPDYMAQNFGYVKIKSERKDVSVYVDGGFADKIEKASKFALKPGNHDIELRDPDGRTIFAERVAVTVGHTTELKVG